MPDATAPAPETHPSERLVTPAGTPVTLPGPAAPKPSLSPQTEALLAAALNTIPPGALAEILKKNWAILMALLIPLLLTTWTNVKEIWSGPTTLTAIREERTADHKAIEALKAQLDVLQKEVKESADKTDKILWILSRQAPSSGPAFP